jgi:hypothetical protein
VQADSKKIGLSQRYCPGSTICGSTRSFPTRGYRVDIVEAVGVESFISDKLMSVSPWMSRCLSGLVHLPRCGQDAHG